jgi:hypothetical protein
MRKLTANQSGDIAIANSTFKRMKEVASSYSVDKLLHVENTLGQLIKI